MAAFDSLVPDVLAALDAMTREVVVRAVRPGLADAARGTRAPAEEASFAWTALRSAQRQDRAGGVNVHARVYRGQIDAFDAAGVTPREGLYVEDGGAVLRVDAAHVDVGGRGVTLECVDAPRPAGG